MKRREFITLLGGGAAAWPFAAAAQQVRPAHRVGLLAQDLQPGLLEIFQDELHHLGYVEGSSIGIEVRNATGKSERLPALASDLLRLKVNVIVAVNTPAAEAAKQATKSIPIVIMRVADPVKSGLVASLARPGGNVTGLSFMPDELGAKGTELLREALPGISRMGALYQGDNRGASVVVDAVASRGTQLGLQVLRLPVVEPKDLAGAFETAALARIEALFVMDDGAMTMHRGQILELAVKYALPVLAIYKDFASAGAIIAYGPRLSVVYRRAAHYVDKILKGKLASDLPIEQPDKFDLFVNLKAAKALGVTIPPSVLLRADEVIE
jgi:putative tryptophan/tyrosine transport system substrate-binding protein